MKKHWTTQVGDFMAGKGFYIVLLLCIAAIGVSGYYFYESLNNQATAVSEIAAITVTPTPAPVEEEVETTEIQPIQPTIPPTTTPQITEETVVTEELVEETLEEAPVVDVAEETPIVATFFSWPMTGTIITDYYVETLAFDETMGDWRTHEGIDISGDLDSDVFATGDGIVLTIEDTDLMGTTITIDHGNGITSTYANLSAQTVVSPGETVYAGQTIGTIGGTAIAESALPDHLHFEMAVDGTSVNPLDYLPDLFN